MQSSIARVALASLVAVALVPASAAAAPTVSVVGRAVPIAGFPHTGNIYGAGAAIHAHIVIAGTEYGGFPEPLVGDSRISPHGSKAQPGRVSGLPDSDSGTFRARA